MSENVANQHLEHIDDHAGMDHHDVDSKTFLGFWLYLMTDCILFATMFATYAVLYKNTFGGPSGKDFIDLPYALTQTLVLLTSSFTCGLAVIAARRNEKKRVLGWLFFTLLLGATFIGLELHEFHNLIREGNSWTRSAFLSSFFCVVATHGAHVSVGLLWVAVLIFQIWGRGLTAFTSRRLICFKMFWHFLDVVWIFVFTIIYLMGVK